MGFFDGIVDAFTGAVDAFTDVGQAAFNNVGDWAPWAAGWAFPEFGAALEGFDLLKTVSSVGDAVGSVSKAAAPWMPLLSGMVGYQGQSAANAANLEAVQKQIDFQRESQGTAMGFNSEQAQRQMDFQSQMWERSRAFNEKQADIQRGFEREMSNTSYQRAVMDLNRAGLNPMLALMKGGASTPSGSAPVMSGASGASGSVGAMPGAAARLESASMAGMNSAAIAAQTRATLAGASKMESEAALNYATIPLREQEVRTSTSSAGELDQRGRLHMYQSLLASVEFNRVQQAVRLVVEQTDLTRAERSKVEQETVNAFLEGRRIEAATSNLRVNTQLHELDLPRMRNEAASNRKHPTLYQDVLPFAGAAAKGVGSAAALGWLLK